MCIRDSLVIDEKPVLALLSERTPLEIDRPLDEEAEYCLELERIAREA